MKVPFTTPTALKRRLLTSAAVVLIAGVTFAPLAAHADTPEGPSGVPGQSCPVEHEDGTVEQVPVGTHYLTFVCGVDGEWHGWGINSSLTKVSAGIHPGPISTPLRPHPSVAAGLTDQ